MQKIFFYFFIFLLPWQTRMIFTPEKPEFLSFSIYLSEIFLWLALAFWLTNADLKKVSTPLLKRGGGGILLFCFFAFLSISWSSDRVAAFRLWLFIFDGIMVYLFLREHSELRQKAIKVFLFSLFIVSLFGIWQFFNLGSPALKWLGLATRGAWNLGDIVVQTDGTRWLRAYGPFSHPNIFGGYLAVGLIIMFNEIKKITKALRSYEFCYIYFLSAVLFFALFLTFSRSAWLALIISAFFLPLARPSKLLVVQERSGVIKGEVRRGILKFILFLFVFAVALSIIFWPLLRTRATSAGRLEQKSNTERVASWREGLAVWYQNPFFGSGPGLGNSTVGVAKPYSQPPHNIFILVLSQLGLVGFAIYLFLWRGFWKNTARFAESRRATRPILILFFIIGLFDHYLWTLYSGQMLFWLGLSLNQD